MTSSDRRILLISYHFPPSAAVGGQRIANFARHLSSFGWEPHVLTIRDRNIEQLDPDRLEGLEHVRIHKVGVLPTPLSIWTAIRTGFRRLRGPKQFETNSEGSTVGDGSTADTENLARKLRRYLFSVLALPDFQNGWIPTAVAAALYKIRKHRIDWIATSCPPYSAHLIGLAVKRLTGRRWVADFRDPWMTADPKQNYTSALTIGIESWLEKKVIENADLLLFNVERLKNAYRERYAHVPAEKFVYIPNGITPRALEKTAVLSKYKTFTLSYTGSLYVGRSPEPVFEAISRLIREGKTTTGDVKIKLAGHCRAVDGVPIAELINKYGLASSVEVCDLLPYGESLKIIRRSHIALLLAPRLPFQIPAKVYDYLGAGSRILAIAENGGTADLIRETGAGQAFAPENVEGIKRFILEEMISRDSTNRGFSNALIRFDIRQITEELTRNLECVEQQRVA